jgi:hypothetical protein
MKLLSEKELQAQIPTISLHTLRAWRLYGKGPAFIKLGRRVLYSEVAINDWLAANTMQSTSDSRHPSRAS